MASIQSNLTAQQAEHALNESRNDFPAGMTEYVSDTDIRHHMMPNINNIVQQGELIWTPPVIVDSNWDSIRVNDTGIMMRNSEALLLDAGVQSGYSSLSWSGLSIPVPTDGLMQMLMYYKTASNPNTIKISLSNAGGSVSYEFNNNWFEKNAQNTFQFWNPATDANHVLGGHDVTVTDSTFDWGSPITGVYMLINSMSANDQIIIDGLYSQTKITPMLCMTFDVANGNVFKNFCPIWKANGWSAALRIAGTTGNPYVWQNYLDENVAGFGGIANEGLQWSYADGFDIYNGSYTREIINGSADEALAREQIGLGVNMVKSQGFTNPILFSANANALPSKAVRNKICDQYGVRWCKAPNGYYYVNVVGPNGLDDARYTQVIGQKSYDDYVNLIAGIIYIGGFLMSYQHECNDFYEADGVTLTSVASGQGKTSGQELSTTSTASGGAVWTEAMQALADHMAPKVAAGEMKVVGITELDLIMRGLA